MTDAAMGRLEALSSQWVKEHGLKGEYQTSLDVAQEVGFEAGFRAGIEMAASVGDDFKPAHLDGQSVGNLIRTLAQGDTP